MTDLERLIAIEDIRRLQARYARLADAKDWRALAALFLPDGSFVSHDLAGQPQGSMRGRADLVRQIGAAVGAGTAIHHLLSYEIEVHSPTRAHAIWAMEDWVDRSAEAATAEAPLPFRTMHGCGHYHTDYEKVDGAWFIASQKLYRVKLEFTY